MLSHDEREDLGDIATSCRDALSDVNDVLQKHPMHSGNRAWSVLRFATKDTAAMRERITSLVDRLHAYNGLLMLSAQARTERKLNKIIGALRRQGSVISVDTVASAASKDREWKSFTAALAERGITPQILVDRHRSFVELLSSAASTSQSPEPLRIVPSPQEIEETIQPSVRPSSSQSQNLDPIQDDHYPVQEPLRSISRRFSTIGHFKEPKTQKQCHSTHATLAGGNPRRMCGGLHERFGAALETIVRIQLYHTHDILALEHKLRHAWGSHASLTDLRRALLDGHSADVSQVLLDVCFFNQSLVLGDVETHFVPVLEHIESLVLLFSQEAEPMVGSEEHHLLRGASAKSRLEDPIKKIIRKEVALRNTSGWESISSHLKNLLWDPSHQGPKHIILARCGLYDKRRRSSAPATIMANDPQTSRPVSPTIPDVPGPGSTCTQAFENRYHNCVRLSSSAALEVASLVIDFWHEEGLCDAMTRVAQSLGFRKGFSKAKRRHLRKVRRSLDPFLVLSDTSIVTLHKECQRCCSLSEPMAVFLLEALASIHHGSIVCGKGKDGLDETPLTLALRVHTKLLLNELMDLGTEIKLQDGLGSIGILWGK